MKTEEERMERFVKRACNMWNAYHSTRIEGIEVTRTSGNLVTWEGLEEDHMQFYTHPRKVCRSRLDVICSFFAMLPWLTAAFAAWRQHPYSLEAWVFTGLALASIAGWNYVMYRHKRLSDEYKSAYIRSMML